jgi:hypothetical protein
MRKLLLALMLGACVLTLSGCFTFDAKHNRHHWLIMKKDFREIHADLDFILALEEESQLGDSYYR